jgi:hypothetical protein
MIVNKNVRNSSHSNAAQWGRSRGIGGRLSCLLVIKNGCDFGETMRNYNFL